MKTKSAAGTPEYIEFDFQVMPLNEAVRLTAAGGGKYEAVAVRLIEQIPSLLKSDPPATLAFGLPGGKELGESERRGVSTSLSASLRKAGLLFRVTYSSSRKVFLAVPRKNFVFPKPEKPSQHEAPIKGKPRKKFLVNGESAEVLKWLLPLTVKTFGPSSANLKKAPGLIRKAFAKVAHDNLRIPFIEIAPVLGLGKGGVKYLYQSRGADSEVTRLSSAVNARGE
jgi:hypothetical protein